MTRVLTMLAAALVALGAYVATETELNADDALVVLTP